MKYKFEIMQIIKMRLIYKENISHTETKDILDFKPYP